MSDVVLFIFLSGFLIVSLRFMFYPLIKDRIEELREKKIKKGLSERDKVDMERWTWKGGIKMLWK